MEVGAQEPQASVRHEPPTTSPRWFLITTPKPTIFVLSDQLASQLILQTFGGGGGSPVTGLDHNWGIRSSTYPPFFPVLCQKGVALANDDLWGDYRPIKDKIATGSPDLPTIDTNHSFMI